MRIKNNDIKVLDFIPLISAYICSLAALYLLTGNLGVLEKVSIASTELQIIYWGMNVVYFLFFLLSLLLIVRTNPFILRNG